MLLQNEESKSMPVSDQDQDKDGISTNVSIAYSDVSRGELGFIDYRVSGNPWRGMTITAMSKRH